MRDLITKALFFHTAFVGWVFLHEYLFQFSNKKNMYVKS